MIATDTTLGCAWMPHLFAGGVVLSHHEQEQLRRVCVRCPVFADCYALAISAKPSDVAGFMAGLTEGQRVARRRRVAA